MRSRRLPPGVGPVFLAAMMLLGVAGKAAAFDNLQVLYGLREYGEYNDNLFSATRGKIPDTAINTNPDVSFLYDDGKTRWLARGNYRRESFIENRDASGDYYAFSGEFSRDLNDRHTFSILGGYTASSSLQAGQPLTEPGQIQVIVPERGARSWGTSWSPLISSFWSPRFTTTLAYDDVQSFTSGSRNLINRSITLSGAYVLSPETVLQMVLEGTAIRNSGSPFADQGDANTFTTQVGFSHVFTPRFTVHLTAGPQWTREINLPGKVTLLKNIRVTETDPVFGTSEQVFLKEPDRNVQDLSGSLAFTLGLAYQINRNTRFSLDASRSTESGQGVNGAFEQDAIGMTLGRDLNRRWHVNLDGRYTRSKSIPQEFVILPTLDPVTGQRQALDRRTFDIGQRLDLTQMFFGSRLDFKINRWWSAYLGWDHTRSEQTGRGATNYHANRVMLGVEFRNETRF